MEKIFDLISPLDVFGNSRYKRTASFPFCVPNWCEVIDRSKVVQLCGGSKFVTHLFCSDQLGLPAQHREDPGVQVASQLHPRGGPS